LEGKATFDNSGMAVHFSGTVQDVTSQVQNQYLIKQKDDQFLDITDNTLDYITKWDLQKNLIWGNRSFYKKKPSDPTPVSSVDLNGYQTKAGINLLDQYLDKVIETNKLLSCDSRSIGEGSALLASFIPQFSIDQELESILVIEHPDFNEGLSSLPGQDFKELSALEELNKELAVVNEEYHAANEELEKINLLLLGDMLCALTGQNTQQHIHNKLIEKAKEVLTFSDLTVGEIAYQLGFEHQQSLRKLFKSKTHFSPLEFRTNFN
jgi:hypothetical protein